MSNEITIFDKIINKDIPAEVVYEDEYILAFKDINPQAPIHVLVIPKNKVSKFSDIVNSDPMDIGNLFIGAAKVASILGLNKDGYRVVINCGKYGQQTVNYLHLHIMGGRQFMWPPG